MEKPEVKVTVAQMPKAKRVVSKKDVSYIIFLWDEEDEWWSYFEDCASLTDAQSLAKDQEERSIILKVEFPEIVLTKG
jgi:hypothetical protein